jgi:hypothetical protein
MIIPPTVLHNMPNKSSVTSYHIQKMMEQRLRQVPGKIVHRTHKNNKTNLSLTTRMHLQTIRSNPI